MTYKKRGYSGSLNFDDQAKGNIIAWFPWYTSGR